MSSYIRSLDGVRALAIVLVLLFHFYYVLEIGWIGVQIFFVLSGYLITNILISSKEGSNLSSYLKRFYWRRTLRIFPLYYAYLIGVTVIYFLTSKPEIFPEIVGYLYSYTYNLQPLYGELTFDPFFTHFWSLSVEEQFYLVWPLLIFLLNEKQTKIAIATLILAVPFFRYFFAEWIFEMGYSEPGEILYRFTISHFDAFAWGGAIAVFKLNNRVEKSGLLLMIGFVLLIGFGTLNLWAHSGSIAWSSLGYPIGVTENYQHVWSYILINMFSTGLILYLIRNNTEKSVLSIVFRNRLVVEIGRLSYGMYVYHWVLLSIHKQYINPLIDQMIISFIIYFFLVFIVSYVSFYTLETFFLKLKEKGFRSTSSS
ncbi:MAG: acyltransferase [Cyclobacteriaceae bacterium]